MGIGGVLLGPIFTSSTHGYDTLDHLSIDPRLGIEADFDALAAACSERGLHLALDGVFNHVGSEHPWVRDAIENGPDSPGAARVNVDRVFEGHAGLVTLRHDSEHVRAYTAEVITHWLDRGAIAWRLDAAYAVPTDFWADVLGRARMTHPDAWFLAEVIHGDYAAFAEASTADTVTQYELWKSIWSSLADRNMFELDWTLTRHLEFCEAFTPATFVGNHDTTRIATQVGSDGSGVHGAVAALAILMTLPGTPTIYAGDEFAMRGLKEERVGGDDAVRPVFPEAPWGSVADAEAAGALPTGAALAWNAHRELIALRQARPWLVTATVEVTSLANERMEYRASARDGGDSISVVIDLAGGPSASVADASGATLWASAG
jgi:glycosidase